MKRPFLLSAREIWSIALSRASSAWDAVWWLRGVTLAFFITNLVTGQLSLLQRVEFLRLTHAIMVLWGKLATEFGLWIGKIPWVPVFDEPQVNSFIVCIAIVLPPAVQIFTPRQSFNFYLRWCAYLFIFLPMMFIWMSYLFRTNTPMLALLFISVAVYSSFRTLLEIYPGFGRGIFTGFTFFLVLEAMYMLQLPIFSEKANEFACSVLDIPDAQCRTEN